MLAVLHILIYLTNYIVFVNTTNKFKFLLRHVSASQGHHQAYKELVTRFSNTQSSNKETTAPSPPPIRQ